MNKMKLGMYEQQELLLVSLVRMNGDIILYKKGFKPQKDFTIFVPTCTG